MIFFLATTFPTCKSFPQISLGPLPGGQSPSSDPPTSAKSRAHTIAGRKITSMMKVQKHFFSLLLPIAFSHGLFSNLYDATKGTPAAVIFFCIRGQSVAASPLLFLQVLLLSVLYMFPNWLFFFHSLSTAFPLRRS